MPCLLTILTYIFLKLSSHFTALIDGKYMAFLRLRFPFFDILGLPFTEALSKISVIQGVAIAVPAAYGSLTDREKEIFALAARGLSNVEIAAGEFLSEATVKTHISRILTKLSLRDRVQLVVFAFEHGLA